MDPFGLTNTDKAICYVEMVGAVSEVQVQFNVETEIDGERFCSIGDTVTFTSSGATVVEHGGSYVRAWISSITGVSDATTDYVNLTLRGY